MKIQAERLRERLDYDPETGIFRWKKNYFSTLIGERAGSLAPNGYRLIHLDGKSYKEHRLAWLYVYGIWPETRDLDHINRVPDDNRIANLREATRAQNMLNSKGWNGASGARGVVRHRNKWQARIGKGGKVYIGTFDSLAEAQLAYMEKAREMFGEFVRQEI